MNVVENAFPATGRSYIADFGDLAFRLDFHGDGRSLTYRAVGEQQTVGAGETAQETVTYTVVPIREGVFLVFWQEASGTTVTHVEDFERGVVRSNITTSQGVFLNLVGTLSPR